MDLIELHTDEERSAATFARPEGHFAHDPRIHCWATLTPEASTAIFRSMDWLAPDYRGVYEKMEKRFSLDFTNSKDVISSTPLVNEGEAHQEHRRVIARHMAERLKAIEQALPALIARFTEPVREKARVELMSECILPFVDAINMYLCGVAVPDNEITVSRIFDPLASIGARRSIEAGLQKIADEAARSGVTSPHDAMLYHALGVDTLSSSIGQTLYAALKGLPPTLLPEVAFPDDFVGTGVPFVQRRAVRDNTVLGHDFKEGELIRVYLLSYLYSEEGADPDKVFGTGRHLCVGRKLSQVVWRDLARGLNRIERTVSLERHALRQADYLFAYPQTLEIALT
ncbi:MAG: hypothetical protein AB7L41_10700 [Flavobacteriaceae bacterium]